MSPYDDDDLAGWSDDPVIRALTAPPTADEVTGEERVLAAFRSRRRPPRRLSAVHRIGLGGGTLLVALGLSGGVAAAAYTSSLPGPVQRAVHDVFAFAGVPAPPRPPLVAAGAHKHPHRHGRPSAVTAGTSAGPTPAVRGVIPSAPAAPGAARGARPVRPSAHPQPPTPSGTPAPAPTPSPTPSPTGAKYGDPTTWSVTASAARLHVPPGSGSRLTGELSTADGRPVAGHRVVVVEHVAGTSGWRRHAVRRTAADGSVALFTGPLSHTTMFVLRAGHGVHSAGVRVVVMPTVTVNVTTGGRTATVHIGTDGADAGDRVTLLRRRDGHLVRVQRGRLDAAGDATFTVKRSPRRTARFAVRVAPTRRHGLGATSFVVPAG